MAGAFFKFLKPQTNVPNTTVQDVDDQIKARTEQKAQDKDQFLGDMSQIESSGGINTNHPVVQNGLQAGDKAVGQYGLMPNTVDEMATRMERDGNAPLDIHMMKVQRLAPQDEATLVNSNPELEKAIADKLYQHVNTKYNGNPEKMNYAWQMGHNTPDASITDIKLETSPRTDKFRKLHQKLAGN